MTITIKTSCYNELRYSRPWIAVVDFADPRGTFAFGHWVGSQGEAGRLVIEAQPGDIVARGQKDFRKPRNSAPKYYVVAAEGQLEPLDSKIAAYDAWQRKAEATT